MFNSQEEQKRGFQANEEYLLKESAIYEELDKIESDYLEQIAEETNSEASEDKGSQKKKLTDEERKRKRIAKIIQKRARLKQQLVTLPYSIVLLPHTEEGHVLSYMAFKAEQFFWLLRKKTGVTISPETLKEISNRFIQSINKLYEITGTSMDPTLMVELYSQNDKERLASMRRSWVLAPRTPEGRMIAYCVKIIDPIIVQIRATENTNKIADKIQKITATMAEINDILFEISKTLMEVLPKPERDPARYIMPVFVKKVIKSKYFMQSPEGNSDNKEAQ